MNTTQKAVILSATHETQDGVILNCPQCGKPVTQRSGHKKKFCSDRCRSAYWNYKYRKGGNPIGKGRPQA